MRKLVIASAIAIGTSLTFGAAANAAGVTVHLDDHHHAPIVVRHDHHHHHRHCWTKTVVTYHHHHKIVKHKRVCD